MPKVVAGPPAAGVVAPNPTCAGPAAGVALADEAPKVNPVEAAGVDAAAFSSTSALRPRASIATELRIPRAR